MGDNLSDRLSYVETVRANTRQYLQEVLDENERLRRLMIDLEVEVTRLKEAKIDLHEQLLAARNELDRFADQERRLHQRLSEIEQQNHDFSSRYLEVEEQNNNLANLYVASYRLHETAGRDEALVALKEIIINLIGSEEFAIFERGEDGELQLAVSFGARTESLAALDFSCGRLASTLATGEIHFDEDACRTGGDGMTPVACVPLKLGGEVRGIIAVFSLLDHKQGMQPLDFELFDLLASQAATSLCLAPHALGADAVAVGG